jgi:hypothetical protein
MLKYKDLIKSMEDKTDKSLVDVRKTFVAQDGKILGCCTKEQLGELDNKY